MARGCSGRNRGSSTGDARGVAGENNVENLSNASSASRSTWARVFRAGGVGVGGLDDAGTGMRTGIESMSESDMLEWYNDQNLEELGWRNRSRK